jgi:hypothetical protein
MERSACKSNISLTIRLNHREASRIELMQCVLDIERAPRSSR